MNLSRWGISALGIAVGVAGVTTAGAQSVQLERSGNSFHAAVCARGNPAGTARCFAHVVTDARGNPHNGKATPAATPSGYGPSQLQSAYNIPAGTGTPTVAIVDAFGYPNAESDLAVYRAQYGLPACTTQNGCLRIVGQNGGKPPSRVDVGWDQEQALDLDMVSAACPNCHILLVQATSATKIKVKLNRKILYEVDGGDRKKVKSFTVNVQPAAITICLPKEESEQNGNGGT